jgi:hypothetical protein
MHVGVQDHDALDVARGLHGARGDSRVVEDAEPLAPVAECVVRPTGEVRR